MRTKELEEFLEKWLGPRIAHGGKRLVVVAALTEERVLTLLRGVHLEVFVDAGGLTSSTENGEQDSQQDPEQQGGNQE